MRRLLALLSTLTLIFAFGTVAALLIGRAQPIPPRLAMLHLTDCDLPCWIGIVPGVTTVGDAKKLIRQMYNADIYSVSESAGGSVGVFSRAANDFSGFSVLLNYPNTSSTDTVYLIVLNPFLRLGLVYGDVESAATKPLGTVMAVYGTNRLFLSALKTSPDAWLVLDGMPTSNVRCIGVSPKNPVLSLGISSDTSRNTRFVPWRGLRTCYR